MALYHSNRKVTNAGWEERRSLGKVLTSTCKALSLITNIMKKEKKKKAPLPQMCMGWDVSSFPVHLMLIKE